jgi:hypothetical protein
MAHDIGEEAPYSQTSPQLVIVSIEMINLSLHDLLLRKVLENDHGHK